MEHLLVRGIQVYIPVIVGDCKLIITLNGWKKGTAKLVSIAARPQMPFSTAYCKMNVSTRMAAIGAIFLFIQSGVWMRFHFIYALLYENSFPTLILHIKQTGLNENLPLEGSP